jgi:hypothetical protein
MPRTRPTMRDRAGPGSEDRRALEEISTRVSTILDQPEPKPEIRSSSVPMTEDMTPLEDIAGDPIEIDLAEEDGGQEEDRSPRRDEDRPPRRTSARDQEPTDLSTQIQQVREAEQRALAEAARARQERDASQRAHQEQVARINRERRQAEYDSVVNAITAEQANAENAQAALQAAWAASDHVAAAEAQRRLSRSEARLVQLEGWKDTEDSRPDEPVVQQQPQPQSTQAARSASDIVNQMTALIPEERRWLLEHPELVTDPRRQQELQGTYYAAERAGLARGTPEYFQFFEERLGLVSDNGQDREPPRKAPPARRGNVQAPVSRSGTNLSNGRQQEDGTKIHLTAQQRQAAKWSGISEREYAKQLKKLQELKSAGYYDERH